MHYPKPKATGGRIIRELIATLRGAGVELPLSQTSTSHILIGVSGGPDSIALAHILIKYGRRIVDPKKIRLLHVNHGWRGVESDLDAQFVKDFGKRWKVPVTVVKLKPQQTQGEKGDSWEDSARRARKRIFEKYAAKHGAVVLTGHQADDLAETVLWRICTGAALTHGGGIAVRHGVELRPQVGIRKKLLETYLLEEGEGWRQDSSNLLSRFLRVQMRIELMPVLERIFPRVVEHLVKLGLDAQRKVNQQEKNQAELLEVEADSGVVLGALALLGVKARRAHWQMIQRKMGKQLRGAAEFHLPGGWILSRDSGRRRGGLAPAAKDRWVLEKV